MEFVPKYEIRFKLKEILDQRGIGQRELARLTNIRHPSIHEMCENKTQRLPLDNLAAMCQVLEVGIQDIIELVPINND